MIKRKANRYTKNQESLQQNSFTAMRGIDSTKAPTQADTVLNACNLDVDYDGGLVLRKPLNFKEFHGSYIDVVYMFDKTSKIYLDTYNISIWEKDKPSPSKISKTIYTDIY